MLVFFVIGDVLGAGIYALVGEVAGETGGAIWAPFLLALLLAMFTAFSYAELVTRFPGAAGAALYANRAFRTPFLTFMVAFAVLASGLASAATIARAFGGQYLAAFVELPVIAVGLGFLLVISLINVRGIRESMRFNFALTLIELGGLLLVVTVGVAALSAGLGEPSRAVEFDPGTPVFLAILGGAGIAFYHVGVEQHWWASAASCGSDAPGQTITMDQFQALLQQKPEKACDEIDWTLFGISMATYNVAASTILGIGVLWAAMKIRRTP